MSAADPFLSFCSFGVCFVAQKAGQWVAIVKMDLREVMVVISTALSPDNALLPSLSFFRCQLLVRALKLSQALVCGVEGATNGATFLKKPHYRGFFYARNSQTVAAKEAIALLSKAVADTRRSTVHGCAIACKLVLPLVLFWGSPDRLGRAYCSLII